MGRRAHSALLALAGASGFCALGYEVLYVRHLTTLLGDMGHVHAALLATFLIGVAAGSRWAHRAWRWLFACEIVTGVFALVLPSVTRSLMDSPGLAAVTGSPTLSVALTVALMAGPSLAIGFSLPLFAAYVRQTRPAENAFQGVYAIYNVGAFAGIFAAELLLVEALGVTGSLRVLGLANIVIGFALFAVGSGREPAPMREARRFAPRIVFALACASFASAAFQMFLLRVSYLVLGPHRENFALALGVVLAGIAAGAWLVARRGLGFQRALVLIPPVLAVTFLFHPFLAGMAAVLGDITPNGPGAVLANALVVAAYGLVPMALFGALVPALMDREQAVAREAGHLLWISGVANAAGYLAYVFVAQPLLSTPAFLTVVGGLVLVAAALARPLASTLADGTAGGRGPRILPWAATAAVASAALFWSWTEASLYLVSWARDIDDDDRVTIIRSRGESATLLETGTGRFISYNGHPSITVEENGQPNVAEIVSGVVPALSAPSLGRALVLGLGSGITAGAAGLVFDAVDVVEINPAFLEMAPLLADANFDIDQNPTANIHAADGRAFLIGREDSYDAIVNSIPAPTYFSAAKIYTDEFYARVARALRPGGVFATWLAANEMTPRGMELVLRTMAPHFDRCEMRILRHGYYMATCGEGELGVRTLNEISAPGVETLESSIGDVISPLGLSEYLEAIRLSADVLDPGPPPGPANTDDRPRLEFMLARSAGTTSSGDPFYDDPDRYGIRFGDEADTLIDVARRLRTLSAVAPPWFDRYGRALLSRYPELRAAWEQTR